MRDLDLSARQLGWAGSAFFFALFAVQVAPSACGSTASVRAGPWPRSRCWPCWARSGSPRASDATDLIAGRTIVGVGCAASFMSVVFLCSRWFDSGQARDRAVLGVRCLQHRHPCGGHAARLDRGHGRLARRLSGSRRRHPAGRRGLPRRRARQAAGISAAPRPPRKRLGPDPARPVGGVAHARPWRPCSPCTSSPTPRC